MIDVLSALMADPESGKILVVEYLPKDRLITLSIENEEKVSSFVIDDPDSMKVIGELISSCGDNLASS